MIFVITVITKIFTKVFDTRHKVSLASNAESNALVAQVFQATVSVLHSHHPLHSVLGREFAKALAM